VGTQTVAIWGSAQPFPKNNSHEWVSVRTKRGWSQPHALNRKSRNVRVEGVSASSYPNGAIRAVWLYQSPASSSGDTFQLRTAVRSSSGFWSGQAPITGHNVADFDSRQEFERPSVVLLPHRSAAIVYKEVGHGIRFTEVVRP
jgi:hypothetical protein